MRPMHKEQRVQTDRREDVSAEDRCTRAKIIQRCWLQNKRSIGFAYTRHHKQLPAGIQSCSPWMIRVRTLLNFHVLEMTS